MYQMRSGALTDTGYYNNKSKVWTGKGGIKGPGDFLNNPAVQEKAIQEYVREIEDQLRSNGALQHLGIEIDGIVEHFPITFSGLIAASLRHGAGGVEQYLAHIELHGWRSDPSTFRKKEAEYRAIETRLKEFSSIGIAR